MRSKVLARRSRGAQVPPAWTSVLAVIAHPDEASFGLGAILDAFIFAGARVEVLCLTHGQAWTMNVAPGDLAALRGAERASAADVLGPIGVKLRDGTDGRLGELCEMKLTTEVVEVADCCHPDGLLAFDAPVMSGFLDHVAATSAGIRAAETLDLPVLGWTLAEPVAARLGREFGNSFLGHQEEQVDLRVTIERARRRMASRAEENNELPGSARRRRLEILADTQSLRWLRA
jgi:LmbE family N-acetylglucosaminyl deacetylase